jgi:hypothetical protein
VVTNRASGHRMLYAERKLESARLRLARTERSTLYWTRILANLRQKKLASFSSRFSRKLKRRRRTELTQVMAYARSNPYYSAAGCFASVAFWAARRFLTASAKQIGDVNAERRCGAFERLERWNEKATLNL